MTPTDLTWPPIDFPWSPMSFSTSVLFFFYLKISILEMLIAVGNELISHEFFNFGPFFLLPQNFTPRDAHCCWQWASKKDMDGVRPLPPESRSLGSLGSLGVSNHELYYSLSGSIIEGQLKKMLHTFLFIKQMPFPWTFFCGKIIGFILGYNLV